MKPSIKLTTLALFLFMMSCGPKEDKKEHFSYQESTTETLKTEAPAPDTESIPASQKVDLTNKGVGPVTELVLAPEIDHSMASQGEALFKTNCTACHKTHKKFIGPAPLNILQRRTPEWVMNMILNPEVMIQKDPLAQELLKEHNGSPMANQSLTEDEARAILEYFRTLKEAQ